MDESNALFLHRKDDKAMFHGLVVHGQISTALFAIMMGYSLRITPRFCLILSIFLFNRPLQCLFPVFPSVFPPSTAPES